MTMPPLATMPSADWVKIADLVRDPYPIYERLRRESPVAWVPALKRVFVSTFDACAKAAQRPDVFTSYTPSPTMLRALGARPMIKKDDPVHANERTVINPAVRPKAIAKHWRARFEANTAHYLDELEAVGPLDADLNRDFASPLAAKNLLDILGFHDVDARDIARWSQDFIAGTGNELDEASIWDRCEVSRADATAALDAAIPHFMSNPDHSMISMLLHSGMPEESVRANVFLAISGGINEPQHMITSIAYLLWQHPEARPAPDAPDTAWTRVFAEAIRFYSPVGATTRATTADVVVEGILIPKGTTVALSVASANRDENAFADPNTFDVHRSERRHLGFGSGPHICAGKWAAETAVAHVAMPALYERFPGVRPDDSRDMPWSGFAFRGLEALPVTWDA